MSGKWSSGKSPTNFVASAPSGKFPLIWIITTEATRAQIDEQWGVNPLAGKGKSVLSRLGHVLASPAAAQLGGSCTYGTSGPIAGADFTGNNWYCNGNSNTYTYPAYWLGSTSTGCTGATAGLVQFTGSSMPRYLLIPALLLALASGSGYAEYFTNSATNGSALWCTSSYPNGCGGNEAWYNTSDLRVKDAVIDLPNARGLDAVLKLRPVTYRRKDKAREQSEHVGPIAQEVEAVYPEVVGVGRDGIKSMAYSDLVVPLIKAVQQLKADNDNLRREVEELRREGGTLKTHTASSR